MRRARAAREVEALPAFRSSSGGVPGSGLQNWVTKPLTKRAASSPQEFEPPQWRYRQTCTQFGFLKRVQERSQVGFLLICKTDREALIIELHDIAQSRSGAVMKIRSASGEAS